MELMSCLLTQQTWVDHLHMPQVTACSAGSFVESWEKEEVLGLLFFFFFPSCKFSSRKISLAIPEALQPNLLPPHSMAGEQETHQPFQLPNRHGFRALLRLS